VTVYPLEERIASTPALLLSGEVVDLASSFRIRRQDEEDRKVFILEPGTRTRFSLNWPGLQRWRAEGDAPA